MPKLQVKTGRNLSPQIPFKQDEKTSLTQITIQLLQPVGLLPT
jgi:hypothetical protein